MREARLIVPFDAFEPPRQWWLEERLYALAGGFTCFVGKGGWQDGGGQKHAEAVWIYDIALEDTAEARADLRDLAHEIAGKLNQQCVYMRFPTGVVELIS